VKTEVTLTFLEDVPLWLSLIGGIFIAAFSVVYAVFAGWRRTPAGRAVMYLTTALSSVMGLVIVRLWSHGFPGDIFLRIAVYGYAAVASGRLLWVLIKQVSGHNPHILEVNRRDRIDRSEGKV
jgi:hypothetical protein